MYPKTILLIDDDPLILTTLSTLLADQGYRIESCRDAEIGFRCLKEAQFDLVISDLQMAPVNGLEFLQAAKHLRPAPGVMIVTAAEELSPCIEALRLGADDYLCKPIRADELLPRVHAYFEKAEARGVGSETVAFCCVCKKVRDDRGDRSWIPPEEYLHRHFCLNSTHAYCPECLEAAKNEITLAKSWLVEKKMDDVREAAFGNGMKEATGISFKLTEQPDELRELVWLYLENLPWILEEMGESIANHDGNRLKVLSATLRQISDKIRAQSISRLAARLEKLRRKEDHFLALETYQELKKEVETANMILYSFLEAKAPLRSSSQG